MTSPTVLVAIANYGSGSREYLDQVLGAYASMPFHVDVVALSNIPKDLGPNVEVRVGLPSPNPRSLPFAHRALFDERRESYDLFIYSEDDTLIREHNVRAFLSACEQLGDDEIAGFVRSEQASDGTVSISSIHTHFRWDPTSVRQRGSDLYARLTNEHAACFMLTRKQLQRAIDSGGFLVPPHEGRYQMLETAATDPYTSCGMTRLVNLSRLDDFILPHLPNKYIGRMGIPRERVQQQVDALCNGAATAAWRGPLFDPETQLPGARFGKNCYEQPDPQLLEFVPPQPKRILSVGCGWGATEAALRDRGHEVTAIPLDTVFGHMVQSAGVRVVLGDFEQAHRAIANESFDLVIFPDALHLVSEPVNVLRLFTGLLADGGRCLISVPNVGDIRTKWRRLKGEPGYRELGSYDKAGVHAVNLTALRRWLAAAGLTLTANYAKMTPGRMRYSKMAAGLADRWLANHWLIEASRSGPCS